MLNRGVAAPRLEQPDGGTEGAQAHTPPVELVITHPLSSAACSRSCAMVSSCGRSAFSASRNCSTDALSVGLTHMHVTASCPTFGLRSPLHGCGMKACMQMAQQHTWSPCLPSSSSTSSSRKGRCVACDRPRTANQAQNISLLAVRCGKRHTGTCQHLYAQLL